MRISYLLFDIGGSSIKYALSNTQAEFSFQGKVKTPRDGLNHLFDELEKIDQQFSDVEGIGISLPGLSTSKEGMPIPQVL